MSFQAFAEPQVMLALGGSATGKWFSVEDAESMQISLFADAAAAGDVFVEFSPTSDGSLGVAVVQQWPIVAGGSPKTLPVETGRFSGFLRVRSVLSAGNAGATFNKMVGGC
jgi:hypothetical protein